MVLQVQSRASFSRPLRATDFFFSRRRTKIAIGTKRAVILGLAANLPARFPPPLFARAASLLPVRRRSAWCRRPCCFRGYGRSSDRRASPSVLPGRERIQGELQALIGVLLRLRLARLVVHDGNRVRARAIHAIDAPGQLRRAHLQFKSCVRSQSLRAAERRAPSKNCRNCSLPCRRYRSY
jgi:hypothetical protein